MQERNGDFLSNRYKSYTYKVNKKKTHTKKKTIEKNTDNNTV